MNFDRSADFTARIWSSTDFGGRCNRRSTQGRGGRGANLLEALSGEAEMARGAAEIWRREAAAIAREATVAGLRLASNSLEQLSRTLESEWSRWFLWTPVLFGAGIAFYFALSAEPRSYLGPLGILASVLVLVRLRHGLGGWLLGAALILTSLGFTAAKLRTEMVRAPVIQKKISTELTGILEQVSELGKKGKRLRLKVVSMSRLPPSRQPGRVRITTRFKAELPPVGTPVRLHAILLPPPEPVHPNGYDFARTLWFKQVGGVGFAIKPPVADPAAANAAPGLWPRLTTSLQRLRRHLHERILAAAPGLSGQFASALITGERSGIPEERYQELREAGLAHVLAISGMHMGIMAGTLFWLVRALLAAFPTLALTKPIKKWAAAAGIFGALCYLAISGASIATQRAFIMTSIMLLAVILDRPAISLRNVALAALIILAVFPESLLEPGFQMSFAAATALVASYEWASQRLRLDPAGHPLTPLHYLWNRLRFYFGGIFVTTLIASLAVAPFAAWHFHEFAPYSLVGNLLAMPVITAIVMPMALVTLLVAPLGLEAWPLSVMSFGLDVVLAMARTVASWPGSNAGIPVVPQSAFALIALGGLWLCLWWHRWRLYGGVAIAAGLALAPFGQHPDILISETGKKVAIRNTGEGLAMLGSDRQNFAVRRWYAAHGRAGDNGLDMASDDASEPGGCDGIGCVAKISGRMVAVSKDAAALRDDCELADIVIASFKIRRNCPRARLIIDRIDLWAHGAHAVFVEKRAIDVVTVADTRGARPWVRRRNLKTRSQPSKKRTPHPVANLQARAARLVR